MDLSVDRSAIELHRLEEELRTVRAELAQSSAEMEELERELFLAQTSSDRTPGALLFFAAMHDGGTVPNLQQLVLQLVNIKPLTDGSEHMDFPTLRKRLQVCVECLPGLQRFISKYTNMHNKWVLERLRLFNGRNGPGVSPEMQLICPLCIAESRQPVCSASPARAVVQPMGGRGSVPTSRRRSITVGRAPLSDSPVSKGLLSSSSVPSPTVSANNLPLLQRRSSTASQVPVGQRVRLV